MNEFMISAPQRKGYETSVVDAGYTTRFAYNVSNQMEYMGEAAPGSATSAAVWKIKKFEYSGDNLISIKFADGKVDSNFIWDNRATYSYS